jgi:DNA polymerase-1
MIFLRADLSQAEDRVVKVYSHDSRMIELARRMPWEFDIHRHNAAIIWKIEPLAVTDEQRQASKKVVHGVNYGEQAMTISNSLLKDGYIFREEECERFRTTFLNATPGIGKYQQLTRDYVFKGRKLTNSWGRSIEFRYERFDDNLFRRAYAWRPQSDVACLLNQAGFIPLSEWLNNKHFHSKINTQTHDEVLVSVTQRNEEAWDIARKLRDDLEVEREYEGVGLSIPVTITLENRYYASKAKKIDIEDGIEIEFKQFPTKEMFDEAFAKVWEKRIC